jgi:hypothetical protein
VGEEAARFANFDHAAGHRPHPVPLRACRRPFTAAIAAAACALQKTYFPWPLAVVLLLLPAGMCIVNTLQPQPTVPCRRTVCQPHVCGHYQRLFVSAVVPPPLPLCVQLARRECRKQTLLSPTRTTAMQGHCPFARASALCALRSAAVPATCSRGAYRAI